MFVDGSNGSVELVGDSIIIRRKGFANILTQGVQGDKQIPLKNITAVQFRSAGSLMAGLLQFSILGGREFRGGMLEATKDENAVMFTREQGPGFATLRNIIQQRINQPELPAMGGGSVDELERLAKMHDAGRLTAMEFADAKRRVLSGSATPLPATPAPMASYVGSDDLELQKKSGSLKNSLIAIAAIIGLLIFIGSINPNP